MNANVLDVDQSNAQQVLIEESQNRLVVVDFWAEWCEHCKNLTPLLEKLAAEYDGKFLLAKVDAEENQMITGQLGVRSLPTVMLFKDGQPIDGFAGAQPESEVRALLEKHLPPPWLEEVSQAQALMTDGDLTGALDLLRQASKTAGNSVEVLLPLASCLIQLNRLDEAESLLQEVKLADQNDYFKTLMAQLELQRESAKSPEIEALERQIADNPNDPVLQLQLAVQYNQHSLHGEALELLLSLLRSDINFGDGEAKKLFLDIITTLGKSDPLSIKYQRKYYTLLY